MCERRSSGTIRFEVVLRKAGKAEVQKALGSSGCERFDRNAYDGVKNIKFDPAIKDGQPVSVMIQLEFNYSID
jgi:TonB family protein